MCKWPFSAATCSGVSPLQVQSRNQLQILQIQKALETPLLGQQKLIKTTLILQHVWSRGATTCPTLHCLDSALHRLSTSKASEAIPATVYTVVVSE